MSGNRMIYGMRKHPLPASAPPAEPPRARGVLVELRPDEIEALRRYWDQRDAAQAGARHA